MSRQKYRRLSFLMVTLATVGCGSDEPSSPQELVAMLASGDEKKMHAAAEKLTSAGSAAVPQLVTLLKDESAGGTSRRHALNCLRKMSVSEKELDEALEGVVNSNDSQLRLDALRTVLPVGQTTTVLPDQFRSWVIKSAHENVRQSAAASFSIKELELKASPLQAAQLLRETCQAKEWSNERPAVCLCLLRMISQEKSASDAALFDVLQEALRPATAHVEKKSKPQLQARLAQLNLPNWIAAPSVEKGEDNNWFDFPSDDEDRVAQQGIAVVLQLSRLCQTGGQQTELQLAAFRSHWRSWNRHDSAKLLALPLTEETKTYLETRQAILRDLLTNSPSVTESQRSTTDVTLKAVRAELDLLETKLATIEAFQSTPQTLVEFLNRSQKIKKSARDQHYIESQLAVVFRDWIANRLPEKESGIADGIKQATHKKDGTVIGQFGMLRGEAARHYMFHGSSRKQIYPSELMGVPQSPRNRQTALSYNVERKKLLANITSKPAWESFMSRCSILDKLMMEFELAKHATYSLPLTSPQMGKGRVEMGFANDAALAKSVLDRWDELSTYMK